MSWIDEIENKDDDLTYYERLKSGIYKSRTYKLHGWGGVWAWLLGMLEDDEYTAEESGPLSATDAKVLTDKRTKREK